MVPAGTKSQVSATALSAFSCWAVRVRAGLKPSVLKSASGWGCYMTDSRTHAGLSLHAPSQGTGLDSGLLIDCSVEVGILQERKLTPRHL